MPCRVVCRAVVPGGKGLRWGARAYIPLEMGHLGRAALVGDAVDLAPARGNVAVVAAAVFSLDEVAHGGWCGMCGWYVGVCARWV
jgi:hypothetical protein